MQTTAGIIDILVCVWHSLSCCIRVLGVLVLASCLTAVRSTYSILVTLKNEFLAIAYHRPYD